jgi:hypothetical protein
MNITVNLAHWASLCPLLFCSPHLVTRWLETMDGEAFQFRQLACLLYGIDINATHATKPKLLKVIVRPASTSASSTYINALTWLSPENIDATFVWTKSPLIPLVKQFPLAFPSKTFYMPARFCGRVKSKLSSCQLVCECKGSYTLHILYPAVDRLAT